MIQAVASKIDLKPNSVPEKSNNAKGEVTRDWLGYRAGERLEIRERDCDFANGEQYPSMMQRWLSEGADEQPYHAIAAIGGPIGGNDGGETTD